MEDVCAVQFTPGGKSLLACSSDGLIKHIDVGTGRTISTHDSTRLHMHTRTCTHKRTHACWRKQRSRAHLVRISRSMRRSLICTTLVPDPGTGSINARENLSCLSSDGAVVLTKNKCRDLLVRGNSRDNWTMMINQLSIKLHDRALQPASKAPASHRVMNTICQFMPIYANLCQCMPNYDMA